MNQKNKLLDVMTFIERAWKFYKENFKKLWPLFLFGSMGGLGFSLRGSASSHTSTSSGLPSLPMVPTWLIVTIIVALVLIYLFMFLSSIALFRSIIDIRKGVFVNVRDGYKKAFKLFFPYLLLVIIITFSSLGAGILLIIPGVLLYGYLFLAPYLFFDQEKRGFAALLGSWSLVRDYWWSLAWRILVVGLLVGLVAFVIIAIFAVLSVLVVILLSLVLKSMVVGIVFASVAVLALILFIVLVIQPVGILAIFEIYYHICEIRAADQLTHDALSHRRKNKIIAALILGLAVVVAQIFYVTTHIKNIPFMNVANTTSSSSSEASSDNLKKLPYVSDDRTFEITLPTGWSFAEATSSGSDAVERITVFISDSKKADITISKLNTAYIHERLPAATTDEEITSKLALAAVDVMKEKLEAAGLKGFQVSDVKKQMIDTDTAYTYRGSASYGAPDYVAIDFEVITVVNKTHGYQLLAIWPESEYGSAGQPLLDSMATFKVAK